MNGSALAIGFLLLAQIGGGEAAQVPAIPPPPEQLPPLLNNAAATPAWKSAAEAATSRAAENLGQDAAPAPLDAAPATLAGSAPARLPDSSGSPPELVAAALRTRDEGPRGEPLALSAALVAISDRSQQAGVVHAYWRLVLAIGLANLAEDSRGRLGQLEATAGELPIWQSARASAAAVAEEAAAEVVSIQHELAALVSRSPEVPLPLPSDPPHVGPYLTHFDRLRSAGRAPASALVIDRRLSILWRAIEARAAAATAADDAYRAASAAYAQGSVELATVIEAAELAHRQHSALLEVVIRYNRDIAGYALVVAPPGTTGPALVQMLIEQAPEPLRPIPTAEDSAIQPAAATEPAVGPRTFAAPPLDARQPTRAVRAQPEPEPALAPVLDDEPGRQLESSPTPAVSEPDTQGPEQAAPVGDTPPTPSGANAAPSDGPPSVGIGDSPQPGKPTDEPTDEPEEPLPSLITSPPGKGWQSGQAAVEPGRQLPPTNEIKATSGEDTLLAPRPVVPVTPTTEPAGAAAPAGTLGLPSVRPPRGLVAPQSDRPTHSPHATFRLGQSDSGGSATSMPGLYGPLRDASPGRRAKQLALTLHWDRVLPEGSGEPLDLGSCLGRCRAEDRPKLLAAYWQVREEAARYQALVEQTDWLQAIAEDDLQAPTSPATTVQLRLRSARLAARAEMHEAHAALVQAQFDLAVLLGRGLEEVWPMASTPPHAGPYLPRLEDQPAEVAASPVVRRRASVLPRLGEAVRQYAAAVVEADAARVDAAERFATGEASPDVLHRAIDRQTDQTLAFLRSLSDYNRAIAAYALAVLPPEVPAETLVSALVVQ